MEAVLCYPDITSYAANIETPGEYAEIAGVELAGMLEDHETPLVLQSEPWVLITAEQLRWISQTYGAEVTRATGAGVSIQTPDLPPLEVMEQLGKTVGALGTGCPEAWLVSMSESEGRSELVLVMGLSDDLRQIEAEVAETITRAIQAVTELPFAVACPDRGAPLMASARTTGIGIGG